MTSRPCSVYFPRWDTCTDCGCWPVAEAPAFWFDMSPGFDPIRTSKVIWNYWALDTEGNTVSDEFKSPPVGSGRQPYNNVGSGLCWHPCIFTYLTLTRGKAKSVGFLCEDHAVSRSNPHESSCRLYVCLKLS